MTAEEKRLEDARQRVAHWRRWGPYLSERAWGTVREDYSADGEAWHYFPYDHARSRVYRWNEDGIAGISDRHQRICFALALWNGRDATLKERLFGVSGKEGNHGEDVKECYFHLDNTPTHAYMKYLYKYPHAAFPYAALVEECRRRTRRDPEYELIDTGVFDEDRYFDVFVEYAKATPEEMLVRITAINRAKDAATLHLLPSIWFRNRWSWQAGVRRPRASASGVHTNVIALDESYYGRRWLICDDAGLASNSAIGGPGGQGGSPGLLFTENETNVLRLFGSDTSDMSPIYAKDGINDRVVLNATRAVNPAGEGTKAAAWYVREIAGGESASWHLRFTNVEPKTAAHANGRLASLGDDFDEVFGRRIREADEFYAHIVPSTLSPDARHVMRQAVAGLLWSKQFYHFVVKEWLDGDPLQPPPPPERRAARNHEWMHIYNADVVSMPDKWEYPWYAAWDLAFHCVPIALVDPDFAKSQLLLFLREWYMHPNGQLPAYEWKFSDVNPPVHAWAAWRVYKIDQKRHGTGDLAFLARVFHKLMLNFTWWVNRKDPEGRNLFQGGFLGLDNIGVFDRSAPLPNGGHLEQSDCTSWMGMYTLNLLAMALELARHDSVYEDVASKFWEHFLYIADAINKQADDDRADLWNEEDGFYYDVLRMPGGDSVPLKVRSMVGLIPLFAVETLDSGLLARLPAFARRLEWFIDHRPDLTAHVACMRTCGVNERRLLALVWEDRLRRVLQVMLDEREFLSPYGIRALSRIHHEHPYHLTLDGSHHIVDYEPGEATTGLFGGNSNWRGPIWFPVNYLIIEALQRFHYYFGDDFTVECPTGSGQMMTLWQVAAELSRRLTRLFLRDANGRRPAFGDSDLLQHDPHWRDYLLFHEYFHGDTGLGLGASHQTGWTALVAKLLQQSGD